MKKSLRQIFEEGTESDLENLVQQNDAPELSEDTLDSIKNKVYAKTGLSQAHAKKKKPLLLRWRSCVAAAACLCLVAGLMFGVGAWQRSVEPISEADLEKGKEIDMLVQNLEIERVNADDICLDANTLAMFIDEENNLVLMSSTEILFQKPIVACEGIVTGWASPLSSQVCKLLSQKTSLLVFQSLFHEVQYLSLDENFQNDRIWRESNYGFGFYFDSFNYQEQTDLFLVVFYDGTIVFEEKSGLYYVSEKESVDLSALKKQLG